MTIIKFDPLLEELKQSSAGRATLRNDDVEEFFLKFDECVEHLRKITDFSTHEEAENLIHNFHVEDPERFIKYFQFPHLLAELIKKGIYHENY